MLWEWAKIQIIEMFTEAPKNNIDLYEVHLQSAEEKWGAPHRNLHRGGLIRYILLYYQNGLGSSAWGDV